jgi:hypothetical protein
MISLDSSNTMGCRQSGQSPVMHAARSLFFEAEYDGTTYRQEFRLDPRMLVPGIMLAVFSLPLIVLTWPMPAAFAVTGIGIVLAALSFAKRHRVVVSPEGYCISWSLPPIGRSHRFDPDDAELILVSGRHGTYRVWLRRGWRRFELLIEAGSRREGDAWIEFLRRVSHGAPAELPKTDDARVLRERA